MPPLAMQSNARITTTIDSVPWQFYIAPMADEKNAKFEHELKRLEKRVDALVHVCNQLQGENHSLKQRQDSLTVERATLLQKNEQVRARVEAMIGRLKAMEQGG
jgi:cell division protein ZapB